jgi:hypothetical protein
VASLNNTTGLTSLFRFRFRFRFAEHVSLRLFTYRIANRPFSPNSRTRTGSPSSEENYFRADTLERFVAKHLLASSSIHAVYRFSIKAFESVRATADVGRTHAQALV